MLQCSNVIFTFCERDSQRRVRAGRAVWSTCGCTGL